MNNLVTFETAKRLKEAGFPQPDFQPMQFWYDDGIKGISQFRIYIVLHVGRFPAGQPAPLMHEICEEPHGQMYGTHANFGEYQYIAFAPTATDILEQLPGYEIGYFPTAKEMWSLPGEWSISDLEGKCPVCEHTNPAEAAAAAWLELNKKNLEV